MRSCEAFGIDALIVTDSRVDFTTQTFYEAAWLFFGMNVFSATNEETLAFYKRTISKSTPRLWMKLPKIYTKKTSMKKSALFFGTEHSGLSDFWLHKGEKYSHPDVWNYRFA